MARIPIISQRTRANAPRATARATPEAFGAQAAGAVRQAAQAFGTAERRQSVARARVGEGDIAVGRARVAASRVRSRNVADIVDAGEDLGNAAFEVYEAVQERERKDQDIETERIVGQHGTSVESRAVELQSKAAPDGDGYSDVVLEEFDKSAQKLLDTAKSDYQRRTMQRALGRQRIQVERNANRWEIDERQKKRRSDLDEVIRQREAAAANSPDGLQQNLQETHALIDRSNLRPSEKLKMKRAADRRFTGIAVKSLTDRDPISALLLMKDKQVQLALGGDIIAARKSVEISLDRQDRRERLERKEASDAAQKEGQDLIAENKLSAEWIEANRDTLSAPSYKYFNDILRKGPSNTDVPTLTRLNDMIETAPKQAREEATQAYGQGLITKSDYNSIRSASYNMERYSANLQERQDAAIGSRPKYFGRVYRQIGDALRPISVGGIISKNEQMARVRAMQEFDEWVNDNPKADFDTAQQKAKDLIKQFQPGGVFSVAGGKKPYGYKGSLNDLKHADLDKVKEKLRNDVAAKKITQRQALDQMRLVKQWEAQLEQKHATSRRQ